MRLPHVDECNCNQRAHHDADSQDRKHEFCSPAPVHAVARHNRSVAEREILRDAVNIGGSEP